MLILSRAMEYATNELLSVVFVLQKRYPPLPAVESCPVLPIIPVELLEQIVDAASHDRPTLCALSLVCKQFLLRCRMYLFAHLTVNIGSPDRLARMDSFLQSMHDNRLLPYQYVHYLTIICPSTPASVSMLESRSSPLGSFFVNLRTVTITGMPSTTATSSESLDLFFSGFPETRSVFSVTLTKSLALIWVRVPGQSLSKCMTSH